ncbi:sumo conjugating enzyme ubc9 a; sumo conjugating enzyme ubc9; sumo conjugating enzyme hus5 [Trichuris trichiura]|uniref:Sumo conjugating enzyme ubc9 a sumo conjugating enzyme ubc9 sumo conjugating enzyme hus5 n=1 Tax=Trichuris trichiura TaxID=36087 RepID=A0A077Z2Z7_TRITR|nr:sumo conjugating enzyme ubc9 a; sumo conjugating enzyme ubc9; sumo conjugating enzyme hus5 [Trichuris trichiura]
MMSLAADRLTEERKRWRKDHPAGFVAKFSQKADGSLDIFKWDCAIPGPADSPWEGGLYKIRVEFPENYPAAPPTCTFKPPLFHPNVFPSGKVCLSILHPEGWNPSFGIRQVIALLIDLDHNLSVPSLLQVLEGIQYLLKVPNTVDPASQKASDAFK